jgi:hypothetical protein
LAFECTRTVPVCITPGQDGVSKIADRKAFVLFPSMTDSK